MACPSVRDCKVVIDTYGDSVSESVSRDSEVIIDTYGDSVSKSVSRVRTPLHAGPMHVLGICNFDVASSACTRRRKSTDDENSRTSAFCTDSQAPLSPPSPPPPPPPSPPSASAWPLTRGGEMLSAGARDRHMIASSGSSFSAASMHTYKLHYLLTYYLRTDLLALLSYLLLTYLLTIYSLT